jgi:hypothetical protein
MFTNDVLPIKIRDYYAYGVATCRGTGKRNVAQKRIRRQFPGIGKRNTAQNSDLGRTAGSRFPQPRGLDPPIPPIRVPERRQQHAPEFSHAFHVHEDLAVVWSTVCVAATQDARPLRRQVAKILTDEHPTD